MMELYACGFNAWNQLLFHAPLQREPHDLWLFQKVLKDETIDIWRADLSSTLVHTTSGLKLAGMPQGLTKRIQVNLNFNKFAEAGNGKVVAIYDQENFKIREFKSWADYPNSPTSEWDLGRTKQIVAGRTNFTALTAEGEVWTWGDVRYQACLGRDIGGNGLSSSASQPGLVADLQSLPTGPITKIASGGFVTAALTTGHDVYLWGIEEFSHIDGQPTPLDVRNSDILDVAVGDGHVIILTSDRKVLIHGRGKNGQLGMGKGVEELGGWVEVDLKLEAGWRPAQVVAGPRCSFVLVSDDV